MKKLMLLGVLFGGILAGSANAGWPEFMHQSHIDRARNNMWPQPFRGIDARAVVAPFDIMKNKGWQRYNTIGSPMFTDSHELTRAGELHLAWVVRSAPANRKSIFVLHGGSDVETAKRVEEVQIAVSRLLPTGALPPIYVTDVEPYVTSGRRLVSINNAMQESIPAPVLPAFSSLNAPANQERVSGDQE